MVRKTKKAIRQKKVKRDATRDSMTAFKVAMLNLVESFKFKYGMEPDVIIASEELYGMMDAVNGTTENFKGIAIEYDSEFEMGEFEAFNREHNLG